LVKRLAPVGYWRLDDSGGTAADSSGHGNIGTLHGTVTENVVGALINDTDTAMSFDGSTGYIEVGTPASIAALFQNHDFSVEYWVKPVSDSNFVFSCGVLNQDFPDQFFHAGFSGAQVKLGFFGDDLVSNSSITTGVYSHVVLTWVASTKVQTIYINGVHDSSRVSSGSLNVPAGSDTQIARANFGSHGGGPYFYQGAVDELAVYSAAMTGPQVFQHYLLGAVIGPQRYILTSGSDGAPDQALQQYVAGINSLCPDLRSNPTAGVSAFYIDDPSQAAVATALKNAGAKGRWINGILGGGTGDI